MHCKVCNDEFDCDLSYDGEHCDEFCARTTDPSITSFHRTLLDQPKPSIFSYYINAFKNRARSAEREEAEERILKSEEYVRLKLLFEENEHTVTGLKKVKA